MTKQNYTHVIGCRSRDSNKMFRTHLAGFACFNVCARGWCKNSLGYV